MVIELMAVHARTTLLKKLPDYDTKIVMINTVKKKMFSLISHSVKHKTSSCLVL